MIIADKIIPCEKAACILDELSGIAISNRRGSVAYPLDVDSQVAIWQLKARHGCDCGVNFGTPQYVWCIVDGQYAQMPY